MPKFCLFFIDDTSTHDRQPTPAELKVYEEIGAWFEEHGRSGEIVGGEELKGPRTARTVRFKGGTPVVHDGPFMEAKEIIGGYAIVEVPTFDAAVALASTWPAKSVVEIRPLVEHEESH